MKMRNPFVFVLRSLVLSLFVYLAWSVWAQAQPATNAPAGPTPEAKTETTTTATAVWLTFGLDRVPFLQSRYLANIPLWQYLASLIYIFLAFYLSKFLDQFIRYRVRKWAEKTATKVDDMFVELVRGPVKIVAFVILLHIGMKVYAWPETLADFFLECAENHCGLLDHLRGAQGRRPVDGHLAQRATTPENEQFSKQLLPLIAQDPQSFRRHRCRAGHVAKPRPERHWPHRFAFHRRAGHRPGRAGHARQSVRRSGRV